MSSSHKQLYREYLRILRVWPKQPNRQHRFDVFLSRLKDEFRKYPIAEKQLQVEALRTMVNDELEKKYTKEDSMLKSYLPTAETFTLLDQRGQQELEVKRSPLKMLLSIITGKEKLRNE
jgi:hypothetical protein